MRPAAYSLVPMLIAGCAQAQPEPADPPPGEWRGVHLMSPGHRGVPLLLRLIEEVLPELQVNQLILEINYGFEWQSHPELRAGDPLTRADAAALRAACDEAGIRFVPMLQCLGHQSWAQSTHQLLTVYPQFDETPDIPRTNEGIYCRSWCPLHPEVNPIIFALFDELIDAFGSTAFHVGMDEVFLIGHAGCARCRGKDPAELFAKAVNDYHAHLVDQRGQTMMMWADRLLDAGETGYGRWEAADNGTAPAIDRIPTDIVMCDWHYELRDSYPSVPIFIGKGFRVWPAGWRTPAATEALIRDSQAHAGPLMLGHLFTTWCGATDLAQVLLRGPGSDAVGGTPPQVAAAMTHGARLLGATIEPFVLPPAAEITADMDPRPLLRRLDEPPAGRVLRELPLADLAGAAAITGAWTWGLIPQEAPRLAGLRFPRATPSQAGQGVTLTLRLRIPDDATKPALRFLLDDTLRSTEWTGFRWYELRAGETLLWEEDAAGERRGRPWQVVPLGEAAKPGEEVVLSLRIVDRKPVHDYATTVLCGGLALIELP